LEAKRAREFGFTPGEFDRVKKSMAAYYERAYNERDKTESGSFAGEYVTHFLEGEPAPGIEYEFKLVQQLLPGITVEEVTALGKTLLGEDSRVILATSPEKPGIKVPAEEELKAALASAESTAGTPGKERTVTRHPAGTNPRTVARDVPEHRPEPPAIPSTRKVDEIGVTIVKFANGVEAWLKPTDFKNDQ